jgi:hypothetical protein
MLEQLQSVGTASAAAQVAAENAATGVEGLNDVSAEEVKTALLAAVVDGTRSVENVLRRLNAFVGGIVTKGISESGAVTLTFHREDGETVEMEQLFDPLRNTRAVSD